MGPMRLIVAFVVGFQLFYGGVVESLACEDKYEQYSVWETYNTDALPLLLFTPAQCQLSCSLYPACIGLVLRTNLPCVLLFNQLSYQTVKFSIIIRSTAYRRIRCGTNQCVASSCNGNGRCIDFINSYRCDCYSGYTGAYCQTNIDDCVNSPCGGRGNCIDLVNAYRCACYVGYAGANCQTDIDDCANSPCNGRGKCVDLVNAYRCDCNSGYSGVNCETVGFYACAGLKKSNPNAASGTYNLFIPSLNRYISLYCDMTTNGGGWTVIQRRRDETLSFDQNWNNYQIGFGSNSGNFWMGNTIISALTFNDPQLLRIEMGSWDNKHAYAHYEGFRVAGSSDKHRLTVGAYTGDAGDSLTYHSGSQFSTSDQDNDGCSCNCAKDRSGAWWFKNCHDSNLNGQYNRNAAYGVGINWRTFYGYSGSLTFTEMKIRPKNF